MVFLKRHYQWIKYLFFLWLMIILVVSSIPRLPNPNLHLGNRIIRADYMIHWIEYAVLSGLFVLWRGWAREKLTIQMVLISLALGFLIAAMDEIHQLIIPGRRFNLYDMMFNFLGVVSGIILAIIYFKKFIKKHFVASTTSQQAL